MDSRIMYVYVGFHCTIHLVQGTYSRTGWTVDICKWIVGFRCTHPVHGTIGQTVLFFEGKLIRTCLKI